MLLARRSLCHALLLSTEPAELTAEETLVSRVHIAGSRPQLSLPGEPFTSPDADTPLESWSKVLEALLGVWV
jgi:hypothetical protein